MENRKYPMYRARLVEGVAKAFTPEITEKLDKIETKRGSLSEEQLLEVVRSEWGGSILSSLIPLDLEEAEIVSLSTAIFKIILRYTRYPWKTLMFYIDISPLDGEGKIVDGLKRRIEWKPTN